MGDDVPEAFDFVEDLSDPAARELERSAEAMFGDTGQGTPGWEQ
jgi:hypothetical protein